MATVLVGLALIAAFVVFCLIEKRRNAKAIDQIKLRVNVNGIRGKSTATRLITSILAEEGYNVIGKTTGTAARMIYGQKGEEAIVRKVEGANIKEQLACIEKAAKLGANAMVCECMAVRPEYQVIVHEQMLQANITVIVNILEDHLDVMGPTEVQIAEAFSKTIPYHGYCVTVPNPYLYILERECLRRASQLVVVDESRISYEYMSQFDYEIFPANIALAFGVAQILGISEETAKKGALHAKADPGAARATKTKDNNLMFVNGFAANEPSSTRAIWQRMEQKGLMSKGVIVLFNGRPDRVDRTQQFIDDFFPQMPSGVTLVCMGQSLSCVRKAYRNGKFPNVKEFACFEGRHVTADVLLYLKDPRFAGQCIFGIGNIHGEGGLILQAMEFGFDGVIEQERGVISRFSCKMQELSKKGIFGTKDSRRRKRNERLVAEQGLSGRDKAVQPIVPPPNAAPRKSAVSIVLPEIDSAPTPFRPVAANAPRQETSHAAPVRRKPPRTSASRDAASGVRSPHSRQQWATDRRRGGATPTRRSRGSAMAFNKTHVAEPHRTVPPARRNAKTPRSPRKE